MRLTIKFLYFQLFLLLLGIIVLINNFMKKSNLILFIAIILFFTACEERIFPIDDGLPPQLVVEGVIEGGEMPTPAIVILTRTLQFTSDGSQISLDDLFVHDAIITVSGGPNRGASRNLL